MIRRPFQEAYLPVLEALGLADLPQKLLSLIQYEKKEYICQEGVPVSLLLLVLDGRAKILTYTEDGRTLMHHFAGPGSIIGEIELLTGRKGAAMYVQAVTPVLCIGISLAEASSLLLESLPFSRHLNVMLAQKLSSANYNAARMVLYSLENRLCSYIEMSSINGVFDERLTQVSELLGTSYRHLLRTIQKLCKEQVLKKAGHSYVILNARLLHQKGQGFYSPK